MEDITHITDAWGLSETQILAVLGLQTWPPQTPQVSHETVNRVDVMTGIYDLLHILYSGELSDGWMSLQNFNPLFHGHRPIDTVTSDNPDHLDAIHAFLAAYAQGK